MDKLGMHVLVELTGASSALLNDEGMLRKMMYEAATAIDATVLKDFFHRFQPQGITGILAISESHLTIHTWPEFNYAAVDIFTCGNDALLEKAILLMKDRLQAKEVHAKWVERGASPFKTAISQPERE